MVWAYAYLAIALFFFVSATEERGSMWEIWRLFVVCTLWLPCFVYICVVAVKELRRLKK